MMNGDNFKSFEQIRPGPVDELHILLDYNENPDNPRPIMLFKPDPDDEHLEIELNREQATKLRDWLDNYLGDKSTEISVQVVETLNAEDKHSSSAVYNAYAVEACIATDR